MSSSRSGDATSESGDAVLDRLSQSRLAAVIGAIGGAGAGTAGVAAGADPIGSAAPDLARLDLQKDEDLNALAGVLLQRFREQDDVEAYSFLIELVHRRLVLMAQGITRRQGLLIDADDLVAGFMARLFTDVRREQPVVRQFLALAYTTMRYDALNQLRLHRRARIRGDAWEQMRAPSRAPIDPAWALECAERSVQARRMAALFLSVVDQCFHALPERDRRMLALREIDGLSYDELGVSMDIPRGQVGMVLKRARGRLARRVEQAFRITVRPADRRPTPASTPP